MPNGVGIIQVSFQNVSGGPVQTPGAISHYSTAPSGGACDISYTFATANTAGNLIFAFLGSRTSPGAASISDTQGNTYTVIGAAQPVDGNDAQIYGWYADGINAGPNTVTASVAASTAQDMDLIVAEYAVTGSSGAGYYAEDYEGDWFSITGSTDATVGGRVIAGGYSNDQASSTWLLYGLHAGADTGPINARVRTTNPGGETAVLFDATNTISGSIYNFLLTAAIPPPVWPGGTSDPSASPALIAPFVAGLPFTPGTGSPGTADDTCVMTSFFGVVESSSNALYAILTSLGDAGYGILLAYKSTDGGATWNQVGGTGPNIPFSVNCPVPISKFGNHIAVCSQAGALPPWDSGFDFGGITVWTFDMSTDAWLTTNSGPAPGTAGGWTGGDPASGPTGSDWIFMVTSVGDYVVAYTTLDETGGESLYRLWVNTWSGGSWGTAAQFGLDIPGSGSGQVMCGRFVDQASETIYVQYTADETWPSDIRNVAISNTGAISASEVILPAFVGTGDYNASLGVGCLFGGNIYIPYLDIQTDNESGLYRIVSNTGSSGAWVTQQVNPTGWDVNQYASEYNQPQAGMCWAIVINGNLRVYWLQMKDVFAQRVMYTISTDGTFNPVPGSPTWPKGAAYDMRVNPPINIPDVLDGQDSGPLFQFSLAPISAGLGLVVDIIGPHFAPPGQTVGTMGDFPAYVLLTSGSPPHQCPLGNRFY